MKNRKYPLISLVMLNYNGLKYLKQTIYPILKLEYQNYEFIIVDNGSTDGSIEFIKKFKKIRLIENGENLGYSKGKNIGVKQAKGTYILLLDNDILISSKLRLDKFIENYDSSTFFLQPLIINKGSKTTPYYGLYYAFYGQNNLRKNYSYKSINNSYKEKIEIPASNGGCVFINKRVFEEMGRYDESQKFHIDDFDIGPRAMLSGYHNYLLNKINVLHLGIDHQLTKKKIIFNIKYLFSGNGRSIIKNYTLKNIIIKFPIFFIFQLIKALRYSFKKGSIKILLAFFWSVRFFLKNLPKTLNQRKIIQSKRIVKEDIFLKIKPTKFD